MTIDDNERFWTCPDCLQENFGASRYCELCGKLRGSFKRGPGPAILARFHMGMGAPTSPQEETSDKPDEAASVGDSQKRKKRAVKVRFLDFSERLRVALRDDGGKLPKGNRSNPIVVLLLALLLWGILRLVGYVPLLLLLRLVTFLLTPSGLIVWLALAYIYSRRREEIHGRIATIRRRFQMFARVVSQAVGSIGWVGARLRGLRRSSTDSDDTASDTPSTEH